MVRLSCCYLADWYSQRKPNVKGQPEKGLTVKFNFNFSILRKPSTSRVFTQGGKTSHLQSYKR